MFSFVARHKIVSLIVFLNVVAILVTILVLVIHSAKTATVNIYVAPSEAVIELNGRSYSNFESYNLIPGDYHAKISMEGMQTKEFDFELYEGEFKRIKDYLLDENGGFDYYLKNPDDISVLAQATDDESVHAFIDEFEAMASILNKLPLEYYDRSDPEKPIGVYIEQSEDTCMEKAICLVVYGGEKNREIALELIREAGYNPDDYEITFDEEPD
ncbi:hypothetical protein IKF20_02695 [Candidatus Saccharibacteria bacterium]|nr:hypothetical protein [Candidatus Saccharibacteria bacterium]